MWNLKLIIKINFFTKQKQTRRHKKKQIYGYLRGKVGRRDKFRVWN